MTNSSLPLDLKYRPKMFSEVIGNVSIVKTLLTRSRTGSLSGRSLMFGGMRGCGKTTLARIVARAIVCDSLQNGEPCNECGSCRSISDESSISFDEYDAATQGTVDRIRSLIQDLDYESTDGKKRVIILDEAHRLSKAAQDALLKSMEDRRLVVILCTTEPRKIVDAIRSRVEEYAVLPPTETVLISHLKQICEAESIKYESDALKMAVQALDCCPRECVCAVDTMTSCGGVTSENARILFRQDKVELVAELLECIDNAPSRAFEILDELSTESAGWIRDTIVWAISGAVRQHFGAKSNFRTSIKFFDVRGTGWIQIAHNLGRLERPTIYDVESALFIQPQSSVSQVPGPRPLTPTTMTTTTTVAASVPNRVVSVSNDVPEPQTSSVTQTPKKVVEEARPPERKVVKSIEIDGVIFSSDEMLTSLDSKIERSSKPPVVSEQVFSQVELDKNHLI